MSRTSSVPSRVEGLDSIRFFAVLWVVFSHCGSPPLTTGLDRENLLALGVQGVYGNLFAGVPAVIVFFVISGFCIHHPFRHPGSFRLLPYLTRRYVRIGVPLLAAVVLASPLGVKLTLFQNSVLWSLLAELIYYTVYPVLRKIRSRMGWNWILAASLVLAYGVVVFFPLAKDYSPFGPVLASVVAFPCWLLGCKLAEQSTERPAATMESMARRLWTWRLTVWFLSWVCSALRFHSPIGYPWTLNLFAFAVFFWLRAEISVSGRWERSRALEWAGTWSYSVYLVHLVAEAAHAQMPLPNLGFNLNWLVKMFVIFGASHVFYLLVEKPGHHVARQLAKRVARN
ncbi:acyltransferase [Prosthecobacter sp.]|uniref:acyltransferase family protein n=1 Tax=Prosthecobacter sp. TaxID=1965333 RepID=UPI001DA3B645|nr:acyltransferase [Prosthecobacter sp.]MCB1275572.1 acyltransferase [Prosthecobacter sp.]